MPIAPPEGVRQLLTSIRLDFGEIPPEYLVPAGDGEYDPALYEDKTPDPDSVWQGVYHEEGASLYPEWDFGRQHYRKNWCVMREKDVPPVRDDFVAGVLQKYGGLVRHLRRTFEAMRDEDRLLKRQIHGDNVDFDALVEALADVRSGSEMSDRLFTRLHRTERNIAVVFMVDMSGSTKGWINDAERESLVLLCEALETLGDRYAIYGFSGMTRKRCELYRIKRIDEPYGEEVKARISGIRPQDYTRMGFAIRHLTQAAERGGGAHQAADHALRRQAGRLPRRLSRQVRHRGHAQGAAGSAARRHPSVLHHHRQGSARLPAPPLRRGSLHGGGRRRAAALQGGGHLPPAHDSLGRVTRRSVSCFQAGRVSGQGACCKTRRGHSFVRHGGPPACR
ncbi:MAG: hypothetical protein MZV65_48845 [Chromatiales bacterium]|nr:hypothetical protein [Chromatiales bacterium]